MPFQCPKCRATIIKRRNLRCEKCGEALPAELLLSPGDGPALPAKLSRRNTPLVPSRGGLVPRKKFSGRKPR